MQARPASGGAPPRSQLTFPLGTSAPAAERRGHARLRRVAAASGDRWAWPSTLPGGNRAVGIA